MPIYDCNAEVTADHEVTDRIEASSPEEADRIFEENIEAGKYQHQMNEPQIFDIMNYGAVEDG